MKQLLFLTFFTILAFNLSAQRFYLGLNAGYSFVTSAGQTDAYNIEETPDLIIYEKLKGGLGAGTNVGFRLGYSLNKYIAIELGANYLFGRTITSESNYTSAMVQSRATFSSTAEMIQLTPQFVFKAPINNSKLIPYVKFGLALGLGTKVEQETYDEHIGGIVGRTLLETNRTIEGNTATGITAALGANYRIAKRTSLFAELYALNLNYEPETSFYTSYRLNEEERINDLSTNQKITTYSDRISTDGTTNTESPNQELTISLPFSNVSFNIGLKVAL